VGQQAYEVGTAAVFVLNWVAIHVAKDADEAVWKAVKRAVTQWRRSSPDTPIYGPDGKTPIDELLAERE
jgi:hypothetical protein